MPGASIRSPGRYGRKTPCSATCSPWSSRSTASCAARSKYPASASKEEVEQLALTEQNIVRHLEGLTVRKVVVIPGKLVNVVAN